MVDFLLDIKETSKALGAEKIDCLTNLFKEMHGKPPCVDKKRYRANYPDQIQTLNYLEQSAHLIISKTINAQQFYFLRPYALPLIKEKKAQDILNLMRKIYERLPNFYKERLDKNITREEFLKVADAPNEATLEALHYFEETHSVWTGWGKGFPYEEGSHINLSEDVLLKESILEILTDYYRWNFINKKEPELYADDEKETPLPKTKIENKKVGRPDSGNELNDAYDLLKKDNKINFSLSLTAHEKLIRDTVKMLRQSNDESGTNYKTICKYLGQRFKEDKKSIN